MTSEEIGIQLDSPFYNLPVLVYAEIFGYLKGSSIGVCRLVCSEWYTMYLRLYCRPNGYCIRTTGGWWNTVRKLEKEFTICLKMKNTEITSKNLKLENVDVADCVTLLEKSSDFREIVNNVTCLTLTNAFFRNCKTLITFLSKFKKLKKLALWNGSFSVLAEMTVFHLKTFSTTVYFPNAELPESLESVFIKVRQDCAAIPLLLLILSRKLKQLKEYHLTVIPCIEGVIQRVASLFPVITCIVSTFQRSTFFLCWGFSQFLKCNSATLKSLYLDWKINAGVIGLSEDRTTFKFRITTLLPLILQAFEPFLKQDTELRLTEFSLRLGDTQIYSIRRQIRKSLLPFLALQIQRELRQITIDNLQDPYPSDGYPFRGLYEKLFDNFPQIQDEQYFSQFSKDMKMDLCLEVFSFGTKEDAEIYSLWMKNKYSLLFLRSLGVNITWPDDNTNHTEELSEWIPRHNETTSENPKKEIQRTFSRLRKLKIHVELKYFKTFNICTVTHICPFLSVLEIVDGKLSLHQTNMVQREDMSLAAFKDSDFRFIITKLKNLQYITIWANLESISDFALTGCPQECCMSGAFGDGENIHNDFMKTVNEALEKEIQIKNDNPDYGKIIQSLRESSISDLRQLKKLSLRGVGGSITDKIISSLIMENGFRRIDELETFEILGSHRISETGKRIFKKAIKEVLL